MSGFFLSSLEELYVYVDSVAHLDIKVGDSSPREQYLEARKYGLRTPLDDIKQPHPSVLIFLAYFKDIAQFRQDIRQLIPLSEISAYCQLLANNLHPYIIRKVLQLDRGFVNAVNTIYKR